MKHKRPLEVGSLESIDFKIQFGSNERNKAPDRGFQGENYFCYAINIQSSHLYSKWSILLQINLRNTDTCE